MADQQEVEAAFNCQLAFQNVASFVIYYIVLLALCYGLHLLLKPLSQPRIISETIVGLFLGNFSLVRRNLLHVEGDPTNPGLRNMKFLTDFGMTLYMFALGLEMDPTVLFRVPRREAIVAYSCMFFTFALTCATTPFLRYAIHDSIPFILAFSIILSSTGSPLLTRVLTDLKIGKSDIGRFAISAAIYSELVTVLIICVGYVIFRPEHNFQLRKKLHSKSSDFSGYGSLPLAAALVVQIVITLTAGPVILRWVNNANPHGKTFKGSHLVLSVAFMVAVGVLSTLFGFSPVLSAFITGVFLPREGRISQFIVTRVNYFLSFMFYPFFFVWVGLEAELGRFEVGNLGSWAKLFGFFAVGTIGKVIGALLSGLIFKFQWPESLSLALLLNVKGHLHIYLAILAMKNNIVNYSTCIGMILAMFLKIVYIPMVAQYIIQRAKSRSPNLPMGLQWHDNTKELRILLGLHGPENVAWAVNLMEISKGAGDPGIVVYATDMIELTDQIASTLVPGGETDAVTVTDKGVIQLRQQITKKLQEYTNDNGDRITVRRLLALAAFNNMPQDVCFLAEDSIVSLIVLPAHPGVQTEGKMVDAHTGFRHVNRKILRHAPCSVAIMVDRGFGSFTLSRTASADPVNVAVIFIGGKDDREALAYAGRVAYHPAVKITVMRFLLDADVESNVRKTAQLEEEMKLDDECFANFYEKQVAGSGGKASYLEKHLVNSAQAYSTLRSLEGQYGLFIVGRGGRVNSVLTAGMNDWEQCPELGPLGDILSGPNFSATASVLIVQQHNPKGDPGGNADAEFSIM